MANIAEQYQPNQRFPIAKVFFQLMLPLVFYRQGYFCVAVARQVDQVFTLFYIEEIDQLSSSGRLADSGQAGSSGQAIDGTGFTGIRTPGEGDLGNTVFRAILKLCRAGYEMSLIEIPRLLFGSL